MRIILGLLFLAAFITQSAFAQSSPFEADVSSDDHLAIRSVLSLHDAQVGGGLIYQHIPRIRLSLKNRVLGRVEVLLNSRQVKNWISLIGTQVDDTRLQLLQGSLRAKGRARGKLQPVAASLIGRSKPNENTLHVTFIHSGRSERAVHVKAHVRDGKVVGRARVSMPPASALFASRSCGTPHAARSLAAASNSGDNGADEQDSSPQAATAAATFRQIELITDADHQFFATFGADSNSQIASFVNSANTVYRNQLGLGFSLVGQTVRTNSTIYPASATDPDTLLNLFYDERAALGAADDAFLFTTKNMDGGVIGYAYVGVVCRDNASSIGWVEHFNSSFTWITFAHEVGHTLNANHVASGIMSATLTNPPPTTFSDQSISQITGFVGTFGPACLSEVNDDGSSSSSSSSSSTSGGTGGGSTGGGDGAMDAQITATFRNRLFETTVIFSSAQSGLACQTSLYGAPTAALLQTAPTALLVSDTPAGFTGVRYTLRNVSPVISLKARVFLYAVNVCSDGSTSVTPTKRLRVGASNGRLRNSSRWLAAVQRRLSAQ